MAVSDTFTPTCYVHEYPQSEWAQFWAEVLLQCGTWRQVADLTDIRPRSIRKYRRPDGNKVCPRSVIEWIIERCELDYDIERLTWLRAVDCVRLGLLLGAIEDNGLLHGADLRRNETDDVWEHHEPGQVWR